MDNSNVLYELSIASTLVRTGKDKVRDQKGELDKARAGVREARFKHEQSRVALGERRNRFTLAVGEARKSGMTQKDIAEATGYTPKWIESVIREYNARSEV